LALLGRLPSAHVDGDVMQASEKPAQQRASRRPRLPNQSFSDLLSGAEKPGGISAFLPKLHSVLL
jgi:hypothetical protein